MKKTILIILTILFLLLFNYPVFAEDTLSKKTENGKYIVDMTINGEDLEPGKNTISLLIRDINARNVEEA